MIVTPEIGDVYGVHDPLEMDYAPRKIKLPESGEKKDGFLVKEYHLDTNHHVNNRQYVQMATEYLPHMESEIKELRAEYRKQAVLGDKIIPVVYTVNSKEIVVALDGEDQKPFAVVQFFLR